MLMPNKEDLLGHFDHIKCKKIVNIFCQIINFVLLFIKQEINLPREKRDHAAIDHVGVVAERLAHLSGAILGVHVDRGLHDGLIFLADDEADVEGLVGALI